mmetsp:Transcript_45029/g.75118  ORF Transcript_45029/g.75118 Transcript_45029/m.75118 type:complete len:507 (+) Transcript_45029:76-1596(+)
MPNAETATVFPVRQRRFRDRSRPLWSKAIIVFSIVVVWVCSSQANKEITPRNLNISRSTCTITGPRSHSTSINHYCLNPNRCCSTTSNSSFSLINFFGDKGTVKYPSYIYPKTEAKALLSPSRSYRPLKFTVLRGGTSTFFNSRSRTEEERIVARMGLDIAPGPTGGKQDVDTKYCFVLIPEDPSEPMQELWGRGKLSNNGTLFRDRFMDAVTRYYAFKQFPTGRDQNHSQIVLSTLKEKAKETGQKLPPVTTNMLDVLQGSQPSELHLLELPSNRSEYVGVTLYADDLGQAKELRVNQRATQLAISCGVLIEVLGDAFVTRVFDDDKRHKFQRLNFTLRDCSSHSKWMRRAKDHNLKRRKGYIQHGMYSQQQTYGLSSSSVTITSPSDAKQEDRPLLQGRIGQFRWKQNWETVEISAPIPSGLSKIHIDVHIWRQKLCVLKCGEMWIARDLYAPISTDDSTWYITNDERNSSVSNLVIMLEKSDPAEWASLSLDATSVQDKSDRT